MAGATKSQGYASLTIAGVDYGLWDTIAGGEVQWANVSYRAAGKKPKLSSGLRTIGQKTFTRHFDNVTDVALYNALAVMQRGPAITASEVLLDVNGNVIANGSETAIGLIASINKGDTDTNSDDARIITIVMDVEDIAV